MILQFVPARSKDLVSKFQVDNSKIVEEDRFLVPPLNGIFQSREGNKSLLTEKSRAYLAEGGQNLYVPGGQKLCASKNKHVYFSGTYHFCPHREPPYTNNTSSPQELLRGQGPLGGVKVKILFISFYDERHRGLHNAFYRIKKY